MGLTKYYWPTLRLDTEKHFALCLYFAETKGTTQTATIFEYLLPAKPFDVVCMNPLQLPCIHQGTTYVL